MTLPRALREALNRQQLSSLALLGQEFWRYPMANPKPSNTNTPTTSNTSPTPASAKTESSGIGTTVFSIHQQKNISTSHTVVGTVFSPSTPSDTASSLSSFTSTGQQILSPESIDSVVLTMSPVDACRTGIIGKTSTFKTQNRKSMDIEKIPTFNGNGSGNNNTNNNINNNGGTVENIENGNVRAVRPTPPNTLNLGPLRIPPAPPPRWAKPATSNSPNDLTPVDGQIPNNFTVTTTVTFSVDGNNQSPQIVEVTSPNANTAVRKLTD